MVRQGEEVRFATDSPVEERDSNSRRLPYGLPHATLPAVEDLRPHGTKWTIQLHETGGKQRSVPCHHALAEALRAYIAAGIAEDLEGSRPGTERLLRPL